MASRHVDAVATANDDTAVVEARRDTKQTGRFKKVCATDPDACMATSAHNRRLEPSYKQHAVVDDVRGVVLDIEVITGETNEGQVILECLDATVVTTGTAIVTTTADAGYAYAKVYGGLERRGIDVVIPAKAEPIRSPVPLRRFRYDARNDIDKCPRGRILRPTRLVVHGRFFYSKARDCKRCDLAARCLSKGRVNKAVVISEDYPALLRARRRRERGSEDDKRLYRRHRWRSEGFHGEAKTWHGLARAVRRGLQNMRIQAFLTAAAVNLKRLAAALLLLFARLLRRIDFSSAQQSNAPCFLVAGRDSPSDLDLTPSTAEPKGEFFNSPRVHFMRNVLAHAGRSGRRGVSAVIATAFAQDDADAAKVQWRKVAHQRRPKVPKLIALMDTAEPDMLAYMCFSAAHPIKLHSTDPWSA